MQVLDFKENNAYNLLCYQARLEDMRERRNKRNTKRHIKKKEIFGRVLIYILMTTAVIGGVIFSLFWAMGYRFDFGSGAIKQVAKLQLGSFPSGADVDINGARLPAATPTAPHVEAGKNTIKFSRKDYRPWQKTVNVVSGEVVWLNYARLIPNNITTETVRNFSDVKQMLLSPNKRWLLIRNSDNSRLRDGLVYVTDHTPTQHQDMSFPLILADISDPLNVRFVDIGIPSDKITAPTTRNVANEKFNIIEWSADSRYILIEHFVNDKVEFLRVDRENPDNTINLSQDFKISPTEMYFSDKSNLLLALIDNSLRLIDLNNTSQKVISDYVQNFTVANDGRLALATLESENDKLVQNVGIYDGATVRNIRSFDTDITNPIAVNLIRFDNNDYLVIGSGELVTIYRDPLGEKMTEPIYLSSPGGIDWISVSPSQRFIMAGRSGKIVGYDLDSKKNYSFEISDTTKPEWVDDHHLIINNNNQIQMIEFDGENRENIVGGFGHAILSSNEKFLFSLSNFNDSVILQKSRLILD